MENEQLVELTADIVAAYVSNNSVSVADIAGLLGGVHKALASLAQSEPEGPPVKTPVVSARASVKPDYLVCMECGARQKMLKRHLQTAHGLTPDQYRADYGLGADYPMVAANYSDRRRALAKKIGLGRKKAEPAKPASAGKAPPVATRSPKASAKKPGAAAATKPATRSRRKLTISTTPRTPRAKPKAPAS